MCLAAGSVGRLWGYWNIKPLTVHVPNGEDEALVAARILRRCLTANSNPVRYKVERVCQRTGVIRLRWVKRRKSQRMRFRLGFVSVDDGAAIGSKLAEALR